MLFPEEQVFERPKCFSDKVLCILRAKTKLAVSGDVVLIFDAAGRTSGAPAS